MKLKITLILVLISTFAMSQVVEITPFATGFTSPVDIAHAGDSRLFVVQQGGAIKILNADGSVNPTNFLTLTNSTILSGGERGLLGLAFHPDYANNGYFFVNYTRAGDGATVIARYSVSAANPNIADPASASTILTIAQPFSNHNGGTIKFGPDGYLYIGTGDGGSGGDPGNRAQNINDNLGKMLRIDVDVAGTYGIPADNPYVGVAGNDEIWAIGLRNPWKFSFDANSGDLWIADVGQSQIEEINFVESTQAGLNYGWRCYEGSNIYIECTTPGLTFELPFAEYTHSGGACSITGGYVYAGDNYPDFSGKYFFADYCVNRIGMVDISTGDIAYSATFSGSNFFTTFGQDIEGELYVAASSGGTIYKIVDSSLAVSDLTLTDISIYPNPADNEITINAPSMSFPSEVRVFDLTGKLLQSAALEQNDQPLDVSGLQPGMYLMNITDAVGTAFTTKINIY
ncbi:MAG: PQQ-dependent sugar dehydrogenase [Flavobacterium sp.]|nr:PQQ-dependent sugar dehydrogenase [Flavobacterium sp.]